MLQSSQSRFVWLWQDSHVKLVWMQRSEQRKSICSFKLFFFCSSINAPYPPSWFQRRYRETRYSTVFRRTAQSSSFRNVVDERFFTAQGLRPMFPFSSLISVSCRTLVCVWSPPPPQLLVSVVSYHIIMQAHRRAKRCDWLLPSNVQSTKKVISGWYTIHQR